MTIAPEPITALAPALRGPVLMNQDWRDLTYLHWAVGPGARSAGLMPPGVRPDTLDGRHLRRPGPVPDGRRGSRIARGPGVPWLGHLPGRPTRGSTPSTTAGRRGVVFLQPRLPTARRVALECP